MATEANVRQSRPLKRRRIIERPRLYALLDESPARIRTLVASAGYGKTTLADQWVRRDGRRGVWYTARRSSTDVAALALGLAGACTELVPECDVRLRAHLRAVPNPGEHVEVLAEILGEELARWSRDDWLVLDEYQELAGARDAERFVEELVSACPLQLLVASRQRPTWVTGRSILYGEVLELNQMALAMDSREAGELLTGRSAPSASGLVALANGWPAVIALASVSSAEIDGSDEVPDSLYRFFAEEVFDALGEAIRDGLATLTVAPLLDRELAADLLGPDAADEVCAAALDVGILAERGSFLELHPLARSFLEERVGQTVSESDDATAATCLLHYKLRRDWDAAFDVVVRRGLGDELESLLQAALDDLLDAARLPTIETWCEVAVRSGVDRPLFAIARAEVALRRGRHAEAQAFAESAASADDPASAFRALSVAGRAAHLASREEEGLELYRRAEAVATTEAARRDALWGQLLCAVELERPEAAITLDQLSAGVHISDATGRVRAAAHRLTYQLRMASIDLDEAETASQVLTVVTDPLVESAFQSVYSSALALSARYREALDVATALCGTADRYRLDFAVPYARISQATAYAGMREFESATHCLDEAEAAARAARDSYAQQLAFAVRMRILAEQGKHNAALSLILPDLRRALPAIQAEVVGSRALVLASVGRTAESEKLLDDIEGTSQGVELAVLSPAVRATSALRIGHPSLIERAQALEEAAFSTGAVDLLVTAYRATPELLAVLLRGSLQPERMADLLRRIGDDDLARVVGEPLALSENPIELLSGRERDVYELLCQGLPNRQIGQLLFISEATVKVHVHHIFDKLGVRSRTALAVQAAVRRSNQATSATRTSEPDAAS